MHYIILRASKEETLKRAVERSKLDRKLLTKNQTKYGQKRNVVFLEQIIIISSSYMKRWVETEINY